MEKNKISTLAEATSGHLYLRISSVKQETSNIRSYVLTTLDGSDLPEFSAGAHLGILMPGRVTRYYSICSSPLDRSIYEIAVLRQPNGRGGSQLLHAKLKAGKIVKILRPRNFFELADRGHHILVAGGIGITPMLAMVETLLVRNQFFELIICAKNFESVPFRDRVKNLQSAGYARVYLSDIQRVNFCEFLRDSSSNRHLYVCGSKRFMDEVWGAASHWPKDNVHLESFTPVTARPGDVAFEVEARRSKKKFTVAADQSILDSLRKNGCRVDSICENGSCGTCVVKLLSGHVEHRDSKLSDDDRKHFIITCVSRASEPLVLDI